MSFQYIPIHRPPIDNIYNLLMLLERITLGLPFACPCERPYLGTLLVSITLRGF